MSVLIKGMKMPKDGAYWCEIGVAGDIAVITIHGEDRKSFHLIELPDHGDLMDMDKFVAEKREQFCADCSKRKSLKTGRFVYEIGDCVCRACDINDMLDYIEDAPVVIPAERSEE